MLFEEINRFKYLSRFSILFLYLEPIPYGSSESDLVLTGDDRTGIRLDAPTGVFVGDGTSGIFSYVTVCKTQKPTKEMKRLLQ